MAANYLKRYQADDHGLRFQDLTYTGNFVGHEPVPDGILGDRIMKSRAQRPYRGDVLTELREGLVSLDMPVTGSG